MEIPRFSGGSEKALDGPVFTTVIPLPMEGVAGQVKTTSGIGSEKRRYNVGKTSEKILQAIEQDDTITSLGTSHTRQPITEGII